VADRFTQAILIFVKQCPYVGAVHDLLTKTRLDLQKGYVIDFYYNATLAKYGYTLIQGQRRVIGWDNARHHPGLTNFPHHFHREDGQVESSPMTGNPEQDVWIVLEKINEILSR